MTTAVLELYKVLVEAGVSEDKAQAAAQAVISREEARSFATKVDIADLKLSIERSEKTTIKWSIASILTILTLNSAILFGVLQIVL